jgi:hypothetical protein
MDPSSGDSEQTTTQGDPDQTTTQGVPTQGDSTEQPHRDSAPQSQGNLVSPTAIADNFKGIGLGLVALPTKVAETGLRLGTHGVGVAGEAGDSALNLAGTAIKSTEFVGKAAIEQSGNVAKTGIEATGTALTAMLNIGKNIAARKLAASQSRGKSDATTIIRKEKNLIKKTISDDFINKSEEFTENSNKMILKQSKYMDNLIASYKNLVCKRLGLMRGYKCSTEGDATIIKLKQLKDFTITQVQGSIMKMQITSTTTALAVLSATQLGDPINDKYDISEIEGKFNELGKNLSTKYNEIIKNFADFEKHVGEKTQKVAEALKSGGIKKRKTRRQKKKKPRKSRKNKTFHKR